MSIFTFTDSHLIVLSNLHTNHTKNIFLHLYAFYIYMQHLSIGSQ